MAGDWIKIEIATPDKPEIIQMASTLGIDQDAVLGKLIRVWAWADQQSIDGEDISVTMQFIDRVVFQIGFAAAMQRVGWLTGDDGAYVLPNFTRHNGKTAKTRAMDNRKKASQREKIDKMSPPLSLICPDSNGTFLGQKTGPEKRREEKSTLSNDNVLTPIVPLKGKRKAEPITNEWLEGLKPKYPHLNIDFEFTRAQTWIEANPSRVLSRKFFANWINKKDPPPQVTPNQPQKNLIEGWGREFKR